MANRGKKSTLRSMTGFGTGSASNKSISVTVEIKSANSRYLDLSFRLPRNYAQLESDIREVVAAQVARGRVEVTVVRTSNSARASDARFNSEAFENLLKIYRDALKKHKLWSKEAEQSSAREILMRKEVLDFGEESIDLVAETRLLKTALKGALEEFLRMRAIEGEKLCTDLMLRTNSLRHSHQLISRQVADRPVKTRDRIIKAVEALAPEVKLDESRLALEVALLVDRQDISEELVRFSSHCDQVEQCLNGGQVGKKLDFLIQELVRETNTIGSKAQDAHIQNLVVDMKSEIERMREQIQNLE